MENRKYIIYTLDPIYEQWGVAIPFHNAIRISRLIARLYDKKVFMRVAE